MININRSALVHYTPHEMYALVDDIDAYPEFLRWCSGASVAYRRGHEVEATLVLLKGAIKQSFTTRNQLTQDSKIEMHLVDGPFRQLEGCWHFAPLGDKGCKVSLEMHFEFSNALLKATFGKVFSQVAGGLVDAFCQRAQEKYGKR